MQLTKILTSFKMFAWVQAIACCSHASSSLPTKVYMPCDTSLTAYAATLTSSDPLSIAIPKCTAPFGACQPSGAGVYSDISDSLVHHVVTRRINNLYMGVNSLIPPSGSYINGSYLYPNTSQVWKQAAVSSGPCSQAGACNQFCGEGIPAPKLAPNGLPVDISKQTMGYASSNTGADDGNLNSLFPLQIPDHNSANGGYTDSTPNISDFSAQGILATTPAASTTFGGWPTFSFFGDDGGSTNACVNSGLDDFMFAIKGGGDVFRGGPAGNVCRGGTCRTKCYYEFPSITWDDGSYSQPASNNQCDHYYIIDFSSASTISSLQMGALVQLNWMALQNIMTTTFAQGYLNLPHVACQTMAADYVTQLRNTLSTLSNVGACSKSAAAYQAACSYDSSGNPLQSDCYIAALISQIQKIGFSQLMECEVYSQANDNYVSLFLDSSNPKAVGAGYFNQLKNWAMHGCLIANLHNVNNSSEQMGGIYGEQDTSTEFNILAGEYPKALANCFPYAYSAVFFSYLKTNPTIPMSTVAVQGASGSTYSSATSILQADGTQAPRLKITNCQITEATPSPTPSPTSPTSSIFDVIPDVEFLFSKDRQHHDILSHSRFAFENSYQTALPFTLACLETVSAVPFSPFRRKKRPKKALGRLSSFAFFLVLMIASFFIRYVQASCVSTYNYTTSHYGYAFVTNYCVGANGIVLSGNATKCCTYAGKGATDFTSNSVLNGHLTNVKGTLAATPPTGVNCPGTVDEVIADLAVLGSTTTGSSGSVPSLISQIQSLAGADGGIYQSTPIKPGSPSGGSGGNNGGGGVLGGFSPNQQFGQATAGGTVPNASKNNIASGPPSASTLAAKAGGTGGSGSGGSGAGGLFSGLGTGTETPGGEPGAGNAASTASGAGAVGGEPEGSRRGGFFNGGSGGNNRPVNEVDKSTIGWGLGNAASGESASEGQNRETLDTADPDDYFSRLGSTDNLFKVIENKYREKTPLMTLNPSLPSVRKPSR